MKKQIALFTILILGLAASASAQLQASTKVESPDQLRAYGWTEASPGVYLAPGDHQEVAFGLPAVERIVAHLDGEIARLSASKERSLDQELKLADLELRRADAVAAARSLTSKLIDPKIESVCWGSANFEHEYYWFSFSSPYVRARTNYGEFGPLSFGSKTTYAFSRICAGSYCNSGGPDIDTINGPTFTLQSEALASISPFWGCTANAFGYVLVQNANGCTDLVSHSSAYSCSQF